MDRGSHPRSGLAVTALPVAPGEILKIMIVTLREWQEFLKVRGYVDDSPLLSMAALEQQTKRHGISDVELKALCDAIIECHSQNSRTLQRLVPCGRYLGDFRSLTQTQNVRLMRSVLRTRKTSTKNGSERLGDPTVRGTIRD